MDLQALGRGLIMRCPICGGGDIFASFQELREECPSCGFRFVREEGYWLGAMIVIMALVLVTFGVLFLGGVLLFWPDVPWTGLLIVTVAANAIVPIVGYPWSKTVWMGIHHAFVTSNRYDPH